MNSKTPYIQINELASLIQEYIEYSDQYKIIFDLYSFQELSLLFAEIDIFDELIGEYDYLKINSKMTVKKCIKICEVFKEIDIKKLKKKVEKENLFKVTEFIIDLYRRSFILFRTMALNLRYTKKDQDDYVLEPEPVQDTKGYHFFTPSIPVYDLIMEIGMAIKTIRDNGISEIIISKTNMIYSRYMFLQYRSLGV